MNKTIAVFGCGWLGLPLAVFLQKKGYSVKGSTTSAEKTSLLEKHNISPYIISISEEEIQGDIQNFLENVDILVINIPPKLRGGGKGESYISKMKLLYHEILKSGIEKIIFVSSTSVYGKTSGEVTEETIPNPVTESGKQLLEVENSFINQLNWHTTIVRFGGLIGPNRHPINMLSGRKNLEGGNVPINLIHLDDCIEILYKIIEGNWWKEVINAVHPYHPSKREYYTKKALEKGIQPPDYKEDNSEKGKKIASKVLLTVKNYKFTTSL